MNFFQYVHSTSIYLVGTYICASIYEFLQSTTRRLKLHDATAYIRHHATKIGSG